MDGRKLREFIHSSLITATQLAFIEKAEKTRTFLKQLDEVLQFQAKEQKVITLFDEIITLEKYASILKTRYGNRYNLYFSNEELYKNVFVTRSTVIDFFDSLLKNLLDRCEDNINIGLKFNVEGNEKSFLVDVDSCGKSERFTCSLI